MSLKEFFKDDKFAALAGCELLDIKPGWATATETLDHRKLPYCVVEIKDEEGNLIATFTGLAYRFPEDDPRNKALPLL